MNPVMTAIHRWPCPQSRMGTARFPIDVDGDDFDRRARRELDLEVDDGVRAGFLPKTTRRTRCAFEMTRGLRSSTRRVARTSLPRQV